jgi:XisH protein
MARDKFHDEVKTALVKDGWLITDDPLYIKVGKYRFRLILGRKNSLGRKEMVKKLPLKLKRLVAPLL